MKIIKVTALLLIATLSFDMAMAQMVRNRAIHFKRHRVVQHHHKPKA